MTQILVFLATHMEFLWSSGRYRITDSLVSLVNGRSAAVIVESDHLRLKLSRDKGQLFLELQPSFHRSESEWFSIDVVRRLFYGVRELTAELDENYAEFMADNLRELEDLFQRPMWDSTEAKLRKIEGERADEMFGPLPS